MRKFEYCDYIKQWEEYERPPLPVRKTKSSAGYDFFVPNTVTVAPKAVVKIPTGIKVKLNDDEYLALHIRSSLGIKHALTLPNCTGIIDSDYYNNPDNEGEIIGAVFNNGNKPYRLEEGETFMQGIICKYHTVDDDEANGERTGGIGSTGK